MRNSLEHWENGFEKTARKEDLKYLAPTDFVFGQSVRLPGEFFEAKEDITAPSVDYVARASKYIANLRYKLPRKTNRLSYFEPDLLFRLHSFTFTAYMFTFRLILCEALYLHFIKDLTGYLPRILNSSWLILEITVTITAFPCPFSVLAIALLIYCTSIPARREVK